MSRKLLSLHRHPPGLLAREALDAILVAGVFDQQVSMLFREDGVRQLVGDTAGEELAESICSLADYGITEVFVCQDSIKHLGLETGELLIPVIALSAAEQGALLARQDMVLCD